MLIHTQLSLRGFVLKTFAVFLCACALSALAADAAKRTYHLPAGDAEKNLKLFIEQSGEQILYSPTKVAGVQTRAVSGAMTSEEALFAMLDQTELVATQDAGSGAFVVSRKNSPPKNSPTPEPKEGPPGEGAKKKLKTFSGWTPSP